MPADDDAPEPPTCPGGHEHHLTALAEPASLERVHALLQALWSDDSEVTAPDRLLFETAVIEIAGNIAQHAPDGRPLEFTLLLRLCPTRLEAEFRDRGRRVDVDLDAAALPDALAESGRGLAITLAAVDELRYHRHDGRNVWHIVRHRR
jgi:serine/threonine-protein kinase RsbW